MKRDELVLLQKDVELVEVKGGNEFLILRDVDEYDYYDVLSGDLCADFFYPGEVGFWVGDHRIASVRRSLGSWPTSYRFYETGDFRVNTMDRGATRRLARYLESVLLARITSGLVEQAGVLPDEYLHVCKEAGKMLLNESDFLGVTLVPSEQGEYLSIRQHSSYATEFMLAGRSVGYIYRSEKGGVYGRIESMRFEQNPDLPSWMSMIKQLDLIATQYNMLPTETTFNGSR